MEEIVFINQEMVLRCPICGSGLIDMSKRNRFSNIDSPENSLFNRWICPTYNCPNADKPREAGYLLEPADLK